MYHIFCLIPGDSTRCWEYVYVELDRAKCNKRSIRGCCGTDNTRLGMVTGVYELVEFDLESETGLLFLLVLVGSRKGRAAELASSEG